MCVCVCVRAFNTWPVTPCGKFRLPYQGKAMAAAEKMLPSSTSSMMFWVLPVVMRASTGFTCWEYPQVLPVVMGVSTGFTCCD